MASESSEDLTVSVDLPAGLVEWLDEEATAADVDRETAIAQLLASYQAITQLNGDVDHESAQFDAGTILDSVEETMAEKVETEVERAVDTSGEREFRADIEDRLDTVEDDMSSFQSDVQSRLSAVDERIDSLDAKLQEKLTDVRKRVVQVKKEADKKAPEDHTHAELERISDLHDEVESLSAEIAQVRSEYEEAVAEQTDHAERLDELQERLQTVAWVVKDLRDDRNTGGLDAVDRIKHAAAQAGIESANCENCTETVNISLMTEPRCPHCEATLSNVEPAKGWFGSAKLTVPSQLESGEQR